MTEPREIPDVYELLSTGELATLPPCLSSFGLPGDCVPCVQVLLPFCRVLVGSVAIGAFEVWHYGKLGASPAEVDLQRCDEPGLEAGESGPIRLSPPVLAFLRSRLLSRIPPRGDHDQTLSFLRDFLRHSPGTRPLLDEADRSRGNRFPSPYIKTAYWGVRMALAAGDRGALGRINLWLRLARDAFDSDEPPRVWPLLSGMPDIRTIRDMEGQGISSEVVRRLDVEESNPAAVRVTGGYLLQYWREVFDLPAVDTLSARILLYLKGPLFNDLRTRYVLSLRDIALTAWGYAEARAAEESVASFMAERVPEDFEGVRERAP
jgi:hypothetical protein